MRNVFILLTFSLSLLTACEKETIMTTALSKMEQATNRSSRPFDFDILKQACFVENIALSIMIENPNHYRYLWEINNKHGGHHIQPASCQCGTAATVRVTRISDGISLYKSVELPACQSLSTQADMKVSSTTQNRVVL